jgi:hypothetical protein
VADGVAQLVGGDGDARCGRAVLGAVEADDGVEVHESAGLELGDLCERDTDALTPGALAHASLGREDADQLDHEAVPQRGDVPVPQHRALVVIGGRVDRLAQLRVVGVVALAAAARAVAVGSAVDLSERRCCERCEDLGCLATCSGTPLRPPAIPA